MSRSTSDGNSSNKILVMVADIAQYFYCPRKIYYLKVLGVPFRVRRKMELGNEEDEKEEVRLEERIAIYDFDRSSVKEIIHDLYLEDAKLGLAGQVDVVIRLDTGEYIPVDSKYTDQVEVQRNYRKQLVAYALLIEGAFHTKVRRGIIYFTKQKKPVVVPLLEEDKSSLQKDLESIRRILTGESIPRKVSESKCGYCEVARFCV
ncbi:MAG: CRISPR-associated protein Cas4 [Candidatus Methanosuratincola petrocarbonis]